MLGSTIIDVAIGLIFIYFLLSMISSQINELIAGWLRWRAKDLEKGVRHLLADPDLANKVWNHRLIQGLAGKEGRAPSYIPANTFALALFDAIVPEGNQPTAIQALRAQVAKMPDYSVKPALLSMMDAASQNMVETRVAVEKWFDAAMDRVTGVYKRRMQYLTLLVALLVTFIVGADSIAIANSLWHEPALRAAVAGAAQTSQAATGAAVPTSPSQAIQDTVSTLSQLSLPIGWSAFPQDAWGWVQKVVGLLLTTLAVSLGAPFWYDLLKNVANLRSSGPAPAKTK